jgi:hypothetical protein
MFHLAHAIRWIPASLGLMLAAAAPGGAATFSQGLTFSAGSQSLWGPGGSSASFAASGSAGIPATFLTPAVGAGYSLSASTGSVSGNLSGSLSASYPDRLAAPGTANLSLGFAITGGSVQSRLGARANVTGYIHDVPFFGPWNFCIYCANYALDTNILLSGASFGSQRSDGDRFDLLGVGPDLTVLGATVAKAQVTLGIDQTARFTPRTVFGDLVYTHRETGLQRLLSFDVVTAPTFDVHLDLPGIWDFGFLDVDLDNRFSTSIGGSLAIDVALLGVISERFAFANLNLLNTPSFGLDFGSRTVSSAFSIEVVPEPSTALLLGAGLAGLAISGRSRSAPPRA